MDGRNSAEIGIGHAGIIDTGSLRAVERVTNLQLVLLPRELEHGHSPTFLIRSYGGKNARDSRMPSLANLRKSTYRCSPYVDFCRFGNDGTIRPTDDSNHPIVMIGRLVNVSSNLPMNLQ